MKRCSTSTMSKKLKLKQYSSAWQPQDSRESRQTSNFTPQNLLNTNFSYHLLYNLCLLSPGKGLHYPSVPTIATFYSGWSESKILTDQVMRESTPRANLYFSWHATKSLMSTCFSYTLALMEVTHWLKSVCKPSDEGQISEALNKRPLFTAACTWTHFLKLILFS